MKYMKCPYCKKDMNKGFISQDRFALKWIPEEKYKGAIFQWFAKGIKLTDSYSNVDSVESYFCENCKKIVIDIEDTVE